MSIDSERQADVLSREVILAAIEAGAEILLDAGDGTELSCHDLALRVFLGVSAKLPLSVVHEDVVRLFVDRLDVEA